MSTMGWGPNAHGGPIVAFAGLDGFLGTRGSLMLDVVVVLLAAVVPVLAWSIHLARRRAVTAHRRIQTVLALALLVVITAFELDVRYFSDWRERATDSPYYARDVASVVGAGLLLHLGIAVPTAVLWCVVVVDAWRRAGQTPTGAFRSRHRALGWAAALGMALTAVTGWVFYYLAFVA